MNRVTVSLFTADPRLAADIVEGLKSWDDLRLVSLHYDRPLHTPEADLLLWDLEGSDDDGPVLPDLSGDYPLTVLYLSDDDIEPDLLAGRRHRSGSRGFLRRRGLVDRIGPAVLAASTGLTVYPSDYLPLPETGGGGAGGPALGLTMREKQILRAVAAGDPNKTIAADLGITERTVKFHLAALFRKLDVQSRTEAAVEGARRGLIPL